MCDLAPPRSGYFILDTDTDPLAAKQRPGLRREQSASSLNTGQGGGATEDVASRYTTQQELRPPCPGI